LLPYIPRIAWGNVIGAQVNSIRHRGDRYISPGVDEDSSPPPCARGLRRLLSNYFDGTPGERFELICGKILLAQLNEIHAPASGFGYLRQEGATAVPFISRELGAIGDVVKQQTAIFGLYGLVLAISGMASALRSVSGRR